MSTSNDGSYIEECVIRVDMKLSGETPQIKTRYLRLSQKVDESTSVVYLCQLTSVDDHVYYPDFKVKITGLSTEQANLLPIKIRGDGETIGVEVIQQNPLGEPIDPFLRIKSLAGGLTPIDYTADVMYSPNIKVNSLGQTVLVQKGRPNRLVASYNGEQLPDYIVNAAEIQQQYIEIEIPLPSFTLNGVTVTPAEGMFERKEKQLLICIIKPRQVAGFQEILKKYPDTFAYVGQVNEIIGKFNKRDKRK